MLIKELLLLTETAESSKNISIKMNILADDEFDDNETAKWKPAVVACARKLGVTAKYIGDDDAGNPEWSVSGPLRNVAAFYHFIQENDPWPTVLMKQTPSRDEVEEDGDKWVKRFLKDYPKFKSLTEAVADAKGVTADDLEVKPAKNVFRIKSARDLKRGEDVEKYYADIDERKKKAEEEEGWFLVSGSSATGEIGGFVRNAATKSYLKKWEVKSPTGVEFDPYKFKGSSFLVKPTSEKALEDVIDAAAKEVNKWNSAAAEAKRTAPERKKAANKLAAERAALSKAEYEKLYGKGTWNRVTYRQENGDDGYQYVVRVDGIEHWNGLTRREAEYYKQKEVEKLAKKEKLGTFGNK